MKFEFDKSDLDELKPVIEASLGELTPLLSVQSWRIARLFELGILPEPQRVSGRRLILKTMVPQIIDALEDRGWLPDMVEEAAAR